MHKLVMPDVAVEMTFMTISEEGVIKELLIVCVACVHSPSEDCVPELHASCADKHLRVSGVSFIADPTGVQTDDAREDPEFLVAVVIFAEVPLFTVSWNTFSSPSR